MIRQKLGLGEECIQGVKIPVNIPGPRTMDGTPFCDPCKFSGKKLTASGFCKSCSGYLCAECIKAHKHGKDTKKHAITKISDKIKATQHQPKPISQCEEHACALESLCTSHDALCCRECVVETHKECRTLVPIHRASEGAKDRVDVRALARDVESLGKKFESMSHEEQSGILGVDVQSKNVDVTVESFRKDVNAMLDKLEASVLLKKDEVVKDEKEVLGQRKKVCEVVIPMLHEIRQQLETADASLDDETAFVASKKVQQKLEKYGEVYDDLLDGRGKFTLKFIPNQSLVRMLDSLGSLVVRSTVQPVGNDSRADGDVINSEMVKVGELIVRSSEDSSIPTITGCTFLGDMRLVLADETNKCLKVLDADGTLITTFKTNCAPWDLVALSDNEVAFRSSFTDKDEDENKIQIVSISSDSQMRIESSFSIDGRPKAIRYFDPHLLIVCSSGKDAYVMVVDRKGNVIKRIKPKRGTFSQPQYLALNQSCDTIYVSDFDNGIIALNTKGEVKMKVHDRVLNEYGGITIDIKGKLYCCAGKPYGIYLVSPDEKCLRPMVVWEEGTIDPQAICFNEKNEQFLVTCCNSDKSFLFSYK